MKVKTTWAIGSPQVIESQARRGGVQRGRDTKKAVGEW